MLEQDKDFACFCYELKSTEPHSAMLIDFWEHWEVSFPLRQSNINGFENVSLKNKHWDSNQRAFPFFSPC